MPPDTAMTFQYLEGAIRGRKAFTLDSEKATFNTSKVRLEVACLLPNALE